MARSFVAASTQNLQVDSVPVSGTPYTMACWFKPVSDSTAHSLMYLGNSGANDDRADLQIRGDQPGKPVWASTVSAGGASERAEAGPITAGQWQHAAGVWASDSSRTAFYNGKSGATLTSTLGMTAPNRMSVGAVARASPVDYMDGAIAIPAIWDVALSADEIWRLAMGESPLKVRPGNLKSYWPLGSGSSGEPNFASGSYPLTLINGPKLAADPPILASDANGLKWMSYSPAAGGGVANPVLFHSHYVNQGWR